MESWSLAPKLLSSLYEPLSSNLLFVTYPMGPPVDSFLLLLTRLPLPWSSELPLPTLSARVRVLRASSSFPSALELVRVAVPAS